MFFLNCTSFNSTSSPLSTDKNPSIKTKQQWGIDALISFKMGTYIPKYFTDGAGNKVENPSQHSIYAQIDTLINDTSAFGIIPLVPWNGSHYDTSIIAKTGMHLKLFWYDETYVYAPMPIHTDTLLVTKDTIFFFDIQIRQ